MSGFKNPRWVDKLQSLVREYERLILTEPTVNQDLMDALIVIRQIKENELRAAKGVVRTADKLITKVEEDLCARLGSVIVDADVDPQPHVVEKEKAVVWSERAVTEAIVTAIHLQHQRSELLDYSDVLKMVRQTLLERGLIGGKRKALMLSGGY